MYTGVCGGQKKESDPLELELEVFVSFLVWDWAQNPGPLQEQQVFLTTETSLQPPLF